MVSQSNSKSSYSPSRDYLEALSDYWGGRPRTAIEHVTQIIAHNPDHPDQFCLYRLWIELLADEGDIYALRSLIHHLERRADANPRARLSYFALRTLIHLELDEWQAVELMETSLQGRGSANPYIQEVFARVSNRRQSQTEIDSLWDLKSKLNDYLHWQFLAVELSRVKNFSALKVCLNLHHQLYPCSPLAQRISMHHAIDLDDWKRALECAQSLLGDFPSHPEYSLVQGVCLYKLGLNDQALTAMQRLVAIEGETDVDLMALLGQIFVDDYHTKHSERARERAGYYLKKAELLLQAMGLSSVWVDTSFQEIRGNGEFSQDRAAQSNEVEAAAWIVKVSAADFFDIRDHEEDQVAYLSLPLHPSARPGQLCFVVHEQRSPDKSASSGFWKIGAVYSVASASKRHPIDGFQSALKLIGRPPIVIPVDIELEHQEDIGQDYINAVQCFELDSEGFEQIARSMEEHLGLEVNEDAWFLEINRQRQAS